MLPTDDFAVLPKTLMVDRIKAAVDVRIDPPRPRLDRPLRTPAAVSPLGHVQERLAAYVEAGADAVGVQLSDAEEFRHVGARLAGSACQSLAQSPHDGSLSSCQLGFRVALLPSSVSLAALSAVKEMLLEFKGQRHGAGLFQPSKRPSGGGALVQRFGYAQAMTGSRLERRPNAM